MSDEFHDRIFLISGPSFNVDLSSLDACHPLHYSRRLLIFRSDSIAQRNAQLHALKTGLEALVNHCPLLAGIIAPLPPEAGIGDKPNWRTILPHHGLELIVKDLRGSMPAFEELKVLDFPAHSFPFGMLMPIPADLDLDRNFPACKVQFSAINGGTIITFSMSHSVADGTGTDELMRLLAYETRLSQEQSGQAVYEPHSSAAATSFMGQDRSLLRSIKSDISFNIEDHPAYMLKSTPSIDANSHQPHPFERVFQEIPVILRIPPSGLAQLKLDATVPGGQRISTHDALCALMWRSALLIRTRRSIAALAVSHSTITEIFMPSDARRHFNLPRSYVGNAVYQLTASLELGILLSPLGLQEAAAAVRRAIHAVNPSIVDSYIAEINKASNTAPLDWQFMKPNAWVTGFAMGTCMASGELIYNDDWGNAFGPVTRFRLVSEAGNNSVMPKLPDGSVEVMISVMPDEVEPLKGLECFGKYLYSNRSL